MQPQSRSDPTASGSGPHRLESDGPGCASPRVLIVEDDADVRKMLEVALDSFGFTVRAAESSFRAQDIVRGDRFDVVLIDLQLPIKDGAETWAMIKAIDPNVRCCFISGSATNCTVEDLMRLGADGFLNKPFPLAALKQMILDSHSKRRLAQTG